MKLIVTTKPNGENFENIKGNLGNYKIKIKMGKWVINGVHFQCLPLGFPMGHLQTNKYDKFLFIKLKWVKMTRHMIYIK